LGPVASRLWVCRTPGAELVAAFKLLGPVKWTYYYLYVLLDIFSRYVVGWLLARQESAALAKVLITESCARPASPRTSSSFMPAAARR
jgi:transposase InsO family protein